MCPDSEYIMGFKAAEFWASQTKNRGSKETSDIAVSQRDTAAEGDQKTRESLRANFSNFRGTILSPARPQRLGLFSFFFWFFCAEESEEVYEPVLSPRASSPPLSGAAPFPRSASSAPSRAASSARARAAAAVGREEKRGKGLSK